MINVNEFRLGNLVNYEKNGVYQNVIYCLNYTTCTIGNPVIRNTVNYKKLFPVTLTEEWITKLCDIDWEVVKLGSRMIWQHKEYRSIKFEFTGEERVAVYFNNELIQFIEHVHTLQNFFFSLTNKELKLPL